MASGAGIGAAGLTLSAVGNILHYLSPAKSPFFWISATATAALIICTDNVFPFAYWVAIEIPIYVVLISSLLLAAAQRQEYTLVEFREHIRFGRSAAISASLVAIVFINSQLVNVPRYFWINYAACLIQMVTFLLYAYARHKEEEGETEFNFVQLSLITTVLLVGAGFALALFVYTGGPENADPNRAVITLENLSDSDILFGPSSFRITGEDANLFELVGVTRTPLAPGEVRELSILLLDDSDASYPIDANLQITTADSNPETETISISVDNYELTNKLTVSDNYIEFPNMPDYDEEMFFRGFSGERLRLVSISLYFLWGVCMIVWVRHLTSIIKITVSVPGT